MTASRGGKSGFRTWQRHEFLLIFKTYRKRLNAASYSTKEIFLRVKETVDGFDLSPNFSDFMVYTGIILLHNFVFSHSYFITF